MSDSYPQAPHPALTEAQIDIARLQEQYTAMKAQLDKVETTLDDVKKLLTEAKGGWKLMMLLGGAAAALGGVLSWFATHTISVGPKL